jgi:DNA-binding transcriptional LysR family regulator
MSDDPLPFLPTFLRVSELGSFTAAARALGITQAAVSQRIQQLEADLRTAVFHRKANQTELTETGLRLLPIARRIAELQRDARHLAGQQKPELSGSLSLAASSVPGEHVLPPIVAAFRHAHQKVRVRLSITDSEHVCRAVEDESVHLGFTGDVPESRRLAFAPFADDDLTLVVSANHRWSHRRRIGWRDLWEEPFIVREPGSGSRRCFEQALHRAGFDLNSFRAILEFGSNEAIKEAVAQGAGVAVLSRRAIHKEIAQGAMAPLALTGTKFDRKLFVVWNCRREIAATGREFLDHLHSALPSLS